MDNTDYFKNAELVASYIKHAQENGLLVEWLATFLDHYATGQYSVVECCFHADWEWDL